MDKQENIQFAAHDMIRHIGTTTMISARNLYHHLHGYDQTYTFKQWLSQYVITPGHIPNIHYIHSHERSDYLLTVDLAIEIAQHYPDKTQTLSYLTEKRKEIYGAMRKKMESINNKHRKEKTHEQLNSTNNTPDTN